MSFMGSDMSKKELTLKELLSKRIEALNALRTNPAIKDTPIGRNYENLILNVDYLTKQELKRALRGVKGVKIY